MLFIPDSSVLIVYNSLQSCQTNGVLILIVALTSYNAPLSGPKKCEMIFHKCETKIHAFPRATLGVTYMTRRRSPGRDTITNRIGIFLQLGPLVLQALPALQLGAAATAIRPAEWVTRTFASWCHPFNSYQGLNLWDNERFC